jgi:choline kinase
MKAIILAAGRGSRMKNLTDTRPKCLTELNGKSLLDRQLTALRDAGIKQIAIVTGYKREMLTNRGLIEFYNSRWADTNMVSSLACAESWLQAETCIVSYSDIFYSEQAVKSLMSSAASLAVTYDPNWLELWTKRFGDPLLDAETFRLKKDSTLAEIGYKPKSVEEVQGQYMGLLRFTPKAWVEIARIMGDLTSVERDKIHMTGTLQRVIEAGRVNVAAVAYKGGWGEIDSVMDLDMYEKNINSFEFVKT